MIYTNKEIKRCDGILSAKLELAFIFEEEEHVAHRLLD